MLVRQTLSLIQQVKELELVGRKNTTAFFTGNYMSAILGHGMEFHEARKYVQGESIRLIDWNMTARLGEVYVKRFREEREREIFLGVDVSPSMFFGTQKRSKIETALEIAATLGFSAQATHDKVGMVCYADKVLDTYLPGKGRAHFFAILKSLVHHKNLGPQKAAITDLRAAITKIQSLKARKFMVFFISDFIEHDIPDDLRLIQDRHEVVLLHVYDPFEYMEAGKAFFPFYSPEGRPSTLSGRPGTFGTLADMDNFLKGSSLKYGIDVVSISTRDAVTKKLLNYFQEKQRRRVR